MDRRWLTFLVLLVLLVGASGLIVLLQGSDEADTTLQLQRATAVNGLPELLVTIADETNDPEIAGGREIVGFECRDGRGERVIQARHAWPLENDGDPPAPHIHQPVTERELARIRTCRVIGTEVALRGRLAPAG
jgi:hypothetical protein